MNEIFRGIDMPGCTLHSPLALLLYLAPHTSTLFCFSKKVIWANAFWGIWFW